MMELVQGQEAPNIQSWIFIGRADVEAEAPILWPPDEKNQLIWKDPDAGRDWGQEEKGTTEYEMIGWQIMLFAAIQMDLEFVPLSEVSQTEEKYLWHALYMESKKKRHKWTYLQKETHRLKGMNL